MRAICEGRPVPGIFKSYEGGTGSDFQPFGDGLLVDVAAKESLHGFEQVLQQFEHEIKLCESVSREDYPQQIFWNFFIGLTGERYRDAQRLVRRLGALDLVRGVNARFNETNETLSRPPQLFRSIASRLGFDGSDAFAPRNLGERGYREVVNQIDGIAQSLVEGVADFASLSPRGFEEVVAALFREFGFDCVVSGGPADHGIDVAATLRAPTALPFGLAQHVTIGVQVKRYALTNKVRERDLRLLLGSIQAERMPLGVMVTSSSVTSAAARYHATRRSLCDRILIVERDHVVELLVAYLRRRRLPIRG